MNEDNWIKDVLEACKHTKAETLQLDPAEIESRLKELVRLRDMAWCIVRNSARKSRSGVPTWSRVGELCGLGSTSAIELCRQYGVDPHAAKVKVTS